MRKGGIMKMAALVMALSMAFSVNVFAAEAEEASLQWQTWNGPFSGTATPYTYRDEFNQSVTATASITGSAMVQWDEGYAGWFISADFNTPDVKLNGVSIDKKFIIHDGVYGTESSIVTQFFTINNKRILRAVAQCDAYGDITVGGEFK